MAPKTYKAQHWVPKSYLAAWQDPDTPTGYEPYVNVISKDGREYYKRAPRNLFTETDMYTIKLPDGQRDLRLEHGLSELESSFAGTRRDFLEGRYQVPLGDYIKLMAFVAATHARTRSMRDHHAKFWTELKDRGEAIHSEARSAPEDDERGATAIHEPGMDGPTLTLDDVRELAANTMQHIFGPFVQVQMPFLMKMECLILCTDQEPGFITSDAPVTWWDAEMHKRPPAYRSTGLLWPKIEITLPVSPRQLLFITHGPAGHDYVEVGADHVSEFNRRTRFYSDSAFVVRRAYLEPYWFDPGEMPADAWEATRRNRSDESRSAEV